MMATILMMITMMLLSRQSRVIVGRCTCGGLMYNTLAGTPLCRTVLWAGTPLWDTLDRHSCRTLSCPRKTAWYGDVADVTSPHYVPLTRYNNATPSLVDFSHSPDTPVPSSSSQKLLPVLHLYYTEATAPRTLELQSCQRYNLHYKVASFEATACTTYVVYSSHF